MEFYKQHIDVVVKQFNSNAQNGLDENAVQSARQKFGNEPFNQSNTQLILLFE